MREAARIQSYPDSFVFKGSRKSVARQIGNSVPPLLATSLAQAVKRTLDTIE
jgi:site-specific DNA-cytosine methylase